MVKDKRSEIIAKTKSDLFLNPKTLSELILNNKTGINKAASFIPVSISSVATLPFSILEGTLISPFRRSKELIIGEVIYPGQIFSENLFSKVDENSNLKQSLYDQYSKEYSLHQISFKITTDLFNSNFRIMKQKIRCTFDDNNIECIDVFPCNKWDEEGLSVHDRQILSANGELELKPSSIFGDANIGNVEAGFNHSRFIEFSTLTPTVVTKHIHGMCAWDISGTYRKFISDQSIVFAANLLVPKNLQKTTATVEIEIGVTDRDRRRADVYPATKDLYMTKIDPEQYKIKFRN